LQNLCFAIYYLRSDPEGMPDKIGCREGDNWKSGAFYFPRLCPWWAFCY